MMYKRTSKVKDEIVDIYVGVRKACMSLCIFVVWVCVYVCKSVSKYGECVYVMCVYKVTKQFKNRCYHF
jgi:hypothetical protein